MKIKNITAFVLVIISLFWLLSCESHEKNPDALSNQYKHNAKKMESTRINKNHPIKIKKVKVFVKKEIVAVDAWALFKEASTKKIHENEMKIAELKAMPTKSTKMNKKIARLEQSNLDLKTRITEFEEQNKNALIEFKDKLNQDISNLGLELTSLEKPVK